MNSRSPLSCYVAILLISALFWHPVIVLADGIVVAPGSGNTSLDRAGNGVPVVDIATPNGRGLSHNKFTDYNVGRRGVILNNATRKLQSTQLGGLIVGNPNLRGQAARLIINEVNGGRPSQLEGYTEVAGSAANVVVANPYGITCNGCGFINSPRVTLSTGQPIIEDGDLDRFAVDQGRVAIEGLGLNAAQVDQFDIITRAAEINAEIHAKNLNVITGANDVDVESLETTARQGTGEAPALAIDSSALGGMYAGSIRLVGTDSGVGVKLAGDMAASDGDIRIDANGHLRLANASSSGMIQAKATYATLSGNVHGSQAVSVRTREDLDIDVTSRLTSAGNITLNAGQTIDHQGIVIAGIENDTFQPGAGLTLTANQLDNHGHLAATQTLTVTTTAATHNHGRLLASEIAVDTATLDNHPDSLIAAGTIEIDADSVDNSGATIEATNTLTVDADTLTNNDGTLTGDSATLTVTQDLTNQRGVISAENGDLTLKVGEQSDNLTGYLNNADGMIEASDTLTVDANKLTNTNGDLRALGGDTSRLTITGTLDNHNGRLEVASDNATLDAGTLLNDQGQLTHTGSGLLRLDADSVTNAGGQVHGTGSGQVTLDRLDDVGEWKFNGALGFTLDQGLTLVAGDTITSATSLTLKMASLDNRGELLANDALAIHASGDITNHGLISTRGDLDITARHLTQLDGRLASGGTSTYHLDGKLLNQGFLTGVGDITITTAHLDNHGTLGSLGNLNIDSSGRIDNRADSLLFSGGDMTLFGTHLLNRYGEIYSQGDLDFARNDDHARAERLENRSGTIEAEGNIDLFADSVKNVRDVIEEKWVEVGGSAVKKLYLAEAYEQAEYYSHGGESAPPDRVPEWDVDFYDLTLKEASEKVVVSSSKSGSIVSGGNLSIRALSVENSASTIAAKGNVDIVSSSLENRGSGERRERIRKYEFDRSYFDVSNRKRFFEIVGKGEESSFGDNALPEILANHELKSDIVTIEESDSSLSGIIQAGDTVSLRISGNVENGTVKENARVQLNGNLGNTGTNAPVSSLTITLNQRTTDGDGRISPAELDSFRLPQGRYGLFVRNTSPQSRYLIETNPEFTSAEQLMGSDYLLDKLDYTADGAYQLLGDGRYELRLIRDAVLANTGQRFLKDSLDDDYAQYRQLMDNAVAAKDALRLSVGVGLTPAQTAALTHDIVWLEEQQVDGQTVLAPVLYLAQVDERNVRGASLIQGRDIDLIAGGDLVNVGTIRATNDLAATSDGSILQGGLLDAGERLDLSAGDSIRNALAGEIRGGQVSLTATEGDIVNDRTAVTAGYDKSYETYLDQGGLISARDGLELNAGRDIVNRAEIDSQGDADLQAGRDIVTEAVVDAWREARVHEYGWLRESSSLLGANVTVAGGTVLDAGRDVRLEASEISSGAGLSIIAANDISLEAGDSRKNASFGRNYRKSLNIEQSGSELSADDDITLRAGRDVTAIASHVTAGSNLTIDTGRNLTLAAAAEVDHSEVHDSTAQQVERRVRQQGSKLEAGNDLLLSADQNLQLIASEAEAKGDAYLFAGHNVALYTANNQDYSLSEKRSGGGLFGSSSYRRDEINNLRAVGSQVHSGNDLSVVSGADQTYQGARLEAGNDLTLASGGAIRFETASDIRTESHEKRSGNFAWQSSEGEGFTRETLRQSELVSRGNLVIQAANRIVVDVPEVNQQTVSEMVDAMVEADSDLAWLKEMETRGDVDWRRVKAIHDTWDYEHSGIGAGAAMVIAIVAAAFGQYYVGPMLGTGTAAAAGGAAAGSMAGTAAVSMVNNRGDLGATLDDTLSSDSLRSATIAAISAGIAKGTLGESINTTTGATTGLGLSKVGDIARFAGQRVTQAVIDAGVRTAIGDGSLSDNLEAGLEDALTHVVSGVLFHAVGDYAVDHDLSEGSPEKIALHALVGGAVSEAMGGDFKTGALAAGASEALADKLVESAWENPLLSNTVAQIVGITAAGFVGGDVEQGAWIAGQAESYNRYLHEEEEALAKELATQSDRHDADDIADGLRYAQTDAYPDRVGINGALADTQQMDTGAWFDTTDGRLLVLSGEDGTGRYLMQDFSQIQKPGADLITFIQQHTGDTYRWPEPSGANDNILPSRDPSTGRILDETGRYYVTMQADGRSFRVPHWPCVGYCDGENMDFSDSATIEWVNASNVATLDVGAKAATAGLLVTSGGWVGAVLNLSSVGLSFATAYHRDQVAQQTSAQSFSLLHNKVLNEVFRKSLSTRLDAALSLSGYYDFLSNDIPNDVELIGGYKDDE